MVVRGTGGRGQDAPVTLDEEMIELRREIHRHPELAGEERETAGLVAEQLRAAGLEVTTGVGGHGLCGHDLHTAIGVGVARTLARAAEQVRGRVVFVFQPAEEPLRGARAMLGTGLVQRLAPREFYAVHCSPYPSGTIAVSPGYGLPGLDHLRIVLPGGDDATAAAVAAEVAAAGTVEFPRSIDEYHARFRALLVPEIAATMQESVSVAHWTGDRGVDVLLRVWPHERLPAARERIEQIAADAGWHVEPVGDPFPAMVNSAELSAAAGRHLSAALGPESVLWGRASWPFNCEDFALFLAEAPGAQFYLGVADREAGINGAPHAPDFAADERAIGHGVRAMAGLLTHRLTAPPR
ncbi:hydrolase [Actinoplanes sp. NBRC 14428]|nr:hydrolase [Actinoplanes sp. NBRC 14428]